MGDKEKKLKVVFFGTPASVIPFMEYLYANELLSGVVTQPSKLAGRGFQLKVSPVGKYAMELNIAHFQPEKLNDPSFINSLVDLKLDLGVVAAFGRKIPSECLEAAREGFVNIHYSLLPKYRGPAPIQHTLLNEEEFAGVTIFYLSEQIDEGPIFVQQKIPIFPEDDYISLEDKLTNLGLELLKDVLEKIKAKNIRTYHQTGTPSKAPLIKKENGRIDWNTNAAHIVAAAKAFILWPNVFFLMGNGNIVKVLQASIIKPVSDKNYKIGEIIGLVRDKGFVVKCRNSSVLIETVHPQGKQKMSGWAFWQGARLKIGDVLR
ncbi:MAG: methionyl-tRNA formyltransferase [bacterium]